MFGHRRENDFLFKIRRLIWPSMGWKRSLRYFSLRIVRLSAAPEPLARAIACGITVSFFPVFGVHALLGFGAALLMRANAVAAALATLVVPPVLLPLIFSLDFVVGKKILQWIGFRGAGNEAAFHQEAAGGANYIVDKFDEFFLPAFIGAGIFMLLVWPATYMGAHKLIEFVVAQHRKRKEKRA